MNQEIHKGRILHFFAVNAQEGAAIFASYALSFLQYNGGAKPLSDWIAERITVPSQLRQNLGRVSPFLRQVCDALVDSVAYNDWYESTRNQLS